MLALVEAQGEMPGCEGSYRWRPAGSYGFDFHTGNPYERTGVARQSCEFNFARRRRSRI